MWKLRLSESSRKEEEEWVRSGNEHIGRQFWEFDPHDVGSEQERAQVEQARKLFTINRFKTKHTSDLFIRLQVLTFIWHGAYSVYTFFSSSVRLYTIYICRLINLQFEREKGLLNIKKKGGYYNKVKIEIKEEEISEEVVESTLKRALRSYSTLQADDGFWPGDYGGPLFLLPGLVIN